MTETSSALVKIFEDPEHAAQYAEGPAKFVPGFEAVHRMANVLIREFTSSNAQLLIHGAGGGLELEALATENPEWKFVGVDPAKPMLDAARKRLGDLNDRVSLHHGYAADAPAGPFDAATSFLTLHFLNADERQKTVSEIVARLKPGAPFIAVHCSFPQDTALRNTWLARHREFVIASGVDAQEAESACEAISEDLEILDPAADEKILHGAGLSDVTQFYAAFTWRGWFGRVRSETS